MRAAVLGGGPAGCAAAIALVNAGIHVVLLERGGRNRDKACGDALVPSSAALFGTYLEGTSLVELGGRPFHEIELTRGAKVLLRLDLGPAVGYTIRRSRIDQAFRDVVAKVGEVHHDTAAIAVRPRRHDILVETRGPDGNRGRLAVDGVIVATGASSEVSRRMDIDGEPNFAASVSAYLSITGPTNPVFEFHPQCQPGYRWVFPMSDGMVNLGVSLLTGHAGRIRSVADNFAAELDGRGVVRWRGGKGPLWSGRGRIWHHPRGIAACGDAAGLVDPSNGEGITAALLSGARAGESLGAFILSGGEPGYLQQYSTWVRDSFTDRYALSGSRIAWRLLCGFALDHATSLTR